MAEVHPDYTDDILRAFGVLCRSDEDEHEAIIDAIQRAGMKPRLMARRLYQLIPLVWGRFLLAGR